MAATITGTLVDPHGSVLANTTFELSGGKSVRAWATSANVTTDGLGAFSLTLSSGRYSLNLNGNSVYFNVPSDTGTFSISDLIER